MSVPEFQQFMNPILKYLNTIKKAVHIADMEDAMVSVMHFTEEQAAETIRSGRNTIVYSRCHWATYYLMRAGLIDRPTRGLFKISDEGIKVVKSGQTVDVAFLKRYPKFMDFLSSTKTPDQKKTSISQLGNQNLVDPEERISQAIDELNEALEDEILTALKSIDPKRFEQIVVDLMEAMHYGDGVVTRYVGDGGIDGIIDEDELGLSKIYLQAKRWNGSKINETNMRDFVGAMATNNVQKGVFITTSEFSEKAVRVAQSAHGLTIVLKNGAELAKLMRKHSLGARQKKNYDIKELDPSYFEE